MFCSRTQHSDSAGGGVKHMIERVDNHLTTFCTNIYLSYQPVYPHFSKDLRLGLDHIRLFWLIIFAPALFETKTL